MTDFSSPISDGGIVYVLTNEAMPNLVKIGRTSGEGVGRRVAELSRATGVPLPFRVAVARRVDDAVVLERALHIAFGPDRVNPSREFFAVEVHRPLAIINAFPGTDLTPEVEAAAEQAIEREEPGSLAAEKRFVKRRPPLNFAEMGLAVGSILTHIDTGEEAIILSEKKVLFRGEPVSLTRAQRLVSGANFDVQPGRFWLTNDRSIADLYEETYPRLTDGATGEED